MRQRVHRRFSTWPIAPIFVAHGGGGCRVGLAPTGKRRLVAAPPLSGHRGSRRWTSPVGGKSTTSNLRKEKRISKSVGTETQAWLSSNPPSGSFAFDLNYLSLLDLPWAGFVASASWSSAETLRTRN